MMSDNSMMSSYDCEDATNENDKSKEFKQLQFVKMLGKYRSLLEKSQKPELKMKKQCDLEEMKKEIEMTLGVTMTKEKILKKISNMKKNVKSKSDLKKTGNVPIKLNPWEMDFLDLLNADTNPVFSKVPGSCKAGFGSHELIQSPASTMIRKNATIMRKSLSRKRLPSETTETEKWTTQELHREVLLQQYHYYKMKRENFQRRSSNDNQPGHYHSQGYLDVLNCDECV